MDADTHVLVTGGGGFIGSRIVRGLAASCRVSVLDTFVHGSRDRVPEGVPVHAVDVRDRAAVQAICADVDVICHQAALIDVPASVEAPARSHAVNATGTVNVLEAARVHDCRVVVASSSAVYGPPETTPIAESHPKRPTSPYGIQKLAADHYTRRYHDLYDLDTLALRYFNVYGPGQAATGYAGVISTFLGQATAGEPITVHGDGSQSRDFVFVDDVVRANLRAIEADVAGRAINVGTGEPTTIAGLAEQVVALVDRPTDIVHTAPRTGDVQVSVADVSRARDLLGFTAETSLRDGLEAMVETRTLVAGD